jgi:hypothetical protein
MRFAFLFCGRLEFMHQRIVVVLIWLLLSVANAQRYSASLQFSSGGAFAALAFSSQFEVAYNPIPELTVGTKVGLQAASLGSALSLRLNPYVFYRILLVSSQAWFLTGYGGINAVYNSANIPTSSTEAGRKKGEDDDLPNNPPIPTPTGVGFQALVLLGIDGAWFIDERNSAYFGLETDVQAIPSLSLTVYPYLEYDLQALDELTVALGGYLGLGSVFSYTLYAYGIYSLSSSAVLRFEVSFTGQLNLALRFSLRG